MPQARMRRRLDRRRVLRVIALLEREYPEAKIALNFTNPLELLVATVLSAQCTDERVNEVTKTLFKKYPGAKDYAKADLGELQQDIRATGFYRNKARFIKEASKIIVEKFGGGVPSSMEELLTLPGVARKTANIVLANAYGAVEGIAVDTHVRRLAQRLGLSRSRDPEEIERDLMAVVPREKWANLNYQLIDHGRRVCKARKPLCGDCALNRVCPSAFKVA